MGFTLVELLVVVAVMVVMMRLAIPAFNAIRGGTDFTSEVYDIAGTFEQARSYAMANNTYVLAGIFEAPALRRLALNSIFRFH
jgi:prepilin-type N-terminal cleavage/methylation domain-containing protein